MKLSIPPPMHEEESITEEVKKEFQLERMILFSDAVFAIVITLMAIEIRLPSMSSHMTDEELIQGLKKLSPVLLAYMVSFTFIGKIWSSHLKIFSLLKDYDNGLIFRNLLLLFFVGLFPFGASVFTHLRYNTFIPVCLYILIIICCFLSQSLLQHYILFKKPGLRNNVPVKKHIDEFKTRSIFLISIFIVLILIIATYLLIRDPAGKAYAVYWTLILPVVLMISKRRMKNKKAS